MRSVRVGRVRTFSRPSSAPLDVAGAGTLALAPVRTWSGRTIAASGPAVFTAVGALALGMPLIDRQATIVQALLLLAVLAGTGAVSGALVGAAVTSRPVGVVELRLRVLAVSLLATAIVPRSALIVGARRGGVAVATLVACWLWLAFLLAIVAVDTWRFRRRPTSLELADPGSEDRVAPEPALPPLCALAKRGIDLVGVLVALPFAVPVVAMAALAVVADSEGGWLFVQTRLGAGGRPFRMAKLRTMTHGSDDGAHRAYMTALITGSAVPAGVYGKVVADPRRTRVGGLLRRLSIDELPQLWNVIKGDMSLIGPRPPLPWEAELYSDRMWGRLAGKPGLTGLWQVEGRGKLPFSQMIELDLRYWERWSPMQDIAILVRTPKAVFWSRNTE